MRGSRRLHSSQEEHKLLVEELSVTNKRVADVNKDLQDANEELQAANEELILAQEEMQATNEEFEATNEELSARSAELQELTRILTAERARLEEMVALAPFCIVVMKGIGLIVAAVNPAGAAVLGVEDARRRPFEELLARDTEPIEAVRAAFREDNIWSSDPREATLMEGGTRVQRTFVFTAVPTHDEGKVDGIVLYGEDVTGMPQRR